MTNPASAAGTKKPIVAIFSTGDMGHAVGRVAADQGCRVVTALDGRSERSRKLASDAGIEDCGSLDAATIAADVILSILPPAEAISLASSVTVACLSEGLPGSASESAVSEERRRTFVDCNAIAPETAHAIADLVGQAGLNFLDGGIVGPAPRKPPATRLYISGSGKERLNFLEDPRLTVRDLGADVGKASALKMCYAAQTKGSWTLFAALMTAAQQLGVSEALDQEFSESQSDVRTAQQRMLPRLPLDAARWVGEMEEIARTFAAVQVPTGFHIGAAEMFRLLASTPFAHETRQDWDQTRTPEATVAAICDVIAKAQTADS